MDDNAILCPSHIFNPCKSSNALCHWCAFLSEVFAEIPSVLERRVKGHQISWNLVTYPLHAVNGSPVKHETTIYELSMTTGTGCFWDKDWLQASRSKWSRLLSFMRTLLLDLQPTVKELRMEVLVLSGFQLWSNKHGLCPHNHRYENYIPKKNRLAHRSQCIHSP